MNDDLEALLFAENCRRQDRGWMREDALRWRNEKNPALQRCWLDSAIRWRDAAAYWAEYLLIIRRRLTPPAQPISLQDAIAAGVKENIGRWRQRHPLPRLAHVH